MVTNLMAGECARLTVWLICGTPCRFWLKGYRMSLWCIAIIVLFAVALILIRPKRIIVLEGNKVVTIRYNGKFSRVLEPGMHWLLFGERRYATVPTRELVYESSLEKIRTKVLFPVTVDIIMHYQVVDPLKMARKLPDWPDEQRAPAGEAASRGYLPRGEYARWFRWQRAIEREAVEALFTVARQRGPTQVAKEPETYEKEIRDALLGKTRAYGVQINEIHLKHVEIEHESIEYEWGKTMAETKVELERIKAEGERAERVKDIRAEWRIWIDTAKELLEALKKAGYDDDQAIQYVNSFLRHRALEKLGAGQVYVGIDTEVRPVPGREPSESGGTVEEVQS